MLPRLCIHLLVIAFLWPSQWVLGLPAMDGMFGRSAMTGVVIGPTPIEAVATKFDNQGHQLAIPRQTRHLTTEEAGTVGNLTMLPNDRMPPLYYLKKERLWQWVNETTVFPINVLNVTTSSQHYRHPPFQLAVGKRVEGVQGGTWRYAGSMLYYDFPGKTETQGLFYKCNPTYGFTGVFMFCQQREMPAGCEPFTLHSFIHHNH